MRKVQFAVKLLPLAPLHPASPPLGRQISELLIKQRAAAPDAPRLLYGRDDANLPLTPHHVCSTRTSCLSSTSRALGKHEKAHVLQLLGKRKVSSVCGGVACCPKVAKKAKSA